MARPETTPSAVVASPEPVTCLGLRAAVTAAGVRVRHMAATEEALAAICSAAAPDVALCDVRLAGDLHALVGVVTPSATRVVVFGDPAGPEDVVAALRAGAGGWMTRAASAEAIGDAVRRVADGHCALDGLAQDSLTTSVLATPVPRAALAKRELEVLRLAAQGQSTPQIAATLFLGERTVKTYLARASLKLGTSGRTAAVAVAIQQQLL